MSKWERQATGSIEDGLAGSAPTLASLPDIFSRLALGQEMPVREKIRARWRRAARRRTGRDPGQDIVLVQARIMYLRLPGGGGTAIVARSSASKTRPGWSLVAYLGGLAWLLIANHDRPGRAIAGVGHAKPRPTAAAAWCERASMVSLARMQPGLLRAAGHHLAITSAAGIMFAGSAVSTSGPIAGSGLGTAFTCWQLKRHNVRDAAAVLALLVSGVLATSSLMAITAAGALARCDWLPEPDGLDPPAANGLGSRYSQR